MIETKEKNIGNSSYAVTQMTARKALRMKAKLLKLFGSSLTCLFLPSNDKNMEGLNFSKEDAIQAIQKLTCELDDKTFENLVVEILSNVRKDGVELTEAMIDLEFAGDLGTLYKVIWFVLEVNFSSFFGESGIGSLLKESKPLKSAVMKRESVTK